jgi:hypothetical protein
MESISNSEWEPDMTSITPNWIRGIDEQNKIRWHQIYYRIIAKNSMTAMDQHNRSLNVDEFTYNGERWARKLIQSIWDMILEI